MFRKITASLALSAALMTPLAAFAEAAPRATPVSPAAVDVIRPLTQAETKTLRLVAVGVEIRALQKTIAAAARSRSLSDYGAYATDGFSPTVITNYNGLGGYSFASAGDSTGTTSRVRRLRQQLLALQEEQKLLRQDLAAFDAKP